MSDDLSKKNRWIGIIAIPILIACGFAVWKYYQSLPSNKILILVADFEGPDPQNYRVTETIVEQLRGATKEYNDVKVQALGEPITAQEDNDVARARGKDKKASIVLWGWYEKAFVTLHFEVLQKPKNLQLYKEKQTLNLALTQLDNFEIQARLSDDMTYLTLLTIGLARYKANDYDGAIALFTDALNQHPVPTNMINPGAIYFYRGFAYLTKGDFDNAITDYNEVIKIKPDLAEAYNNHGLAYLNKKEYISAIADFNQAIQLKPDYAIAYVNRGLTYHYKGDQNLAIADHNQAIKLEPNLADAYYNRGLAYHYKGDYKSAIIDYNKAIEFKPDYAKAY
ncbi:MAG: tetratricopeptide repeat protein, partial [Deltaproteobacteria bacterium]|nr:tetratricopeptide repeat protein [Deltaproteobacteria bacterium]